MVLSRLRIGDFTYGGASKYKTILPNPNAFNHRGENCFAYTKYTCKRIIDSCYTLPFWVQHNMKRTNKTNILSKE